MDDPQKNRQALEALSRGLGATLFGVAQLPRLVRETALLPPETFDRLPFAVSIGYHLSDAILEGIEDGPTPHYFHHYQRVNILLDTIALQISGAIQEREFQSMPIAASQIIDWKGQRGHLSHKHVAQAAGLGWIGRNNLLVHERFGSRIRLVTLLTDLPLQPDPPLIRDCGSCRACLGVCPAGAIQERPEDFDHLRCYEQLKLFSKTLHLSQHICGLCVKACRGQRRAGVGAPNPMP